MPFTLTGAQVAELCDKYGVSQAELARSLGYTRQGIHRWTAHKDKRIPPTQYQRVLAFFVARRDDSRDLAAVAASI